MNKIYAESSMSHCETASLQQGHQLPLLHREALSFEPTKGGLLVRCGYTGESFGGIYSQGEAAWLQQHFRDRTCPISPVEFGAAAELAVRGGAA